MTKKQTQTTVEELINSLTKEERKKFDQGYQEFLISELLHALMKKDAVSVRELARAAGVSPTIVQGLKSGKRTNVTLATVSKVLDAVGYQLAVEPKASNR